MRAGSLSVERVGGCRTVPGVGCWCPGSLRLSLGCVGRGGAGLAWPGSPELPVPSECPLSSLILPSPCSLLVLSKEAVGFLGFQTRRVV